MVMAVLIVGSNHQGGLIRFHIVEGFMRGLGGFGGFGMPGRFGDADDDEPDAGGQVSTAMDSDGHTNTTRRRSTEMMPATTYQRCWAYGSTETDCDPGSHLGR